MKWIGLLVLLILLTATQATSQIADDKLIVPGFRIGKWTLDMTMAKLVQMNGPAQSTPWTAGGADLKDGIWRHTWGHLSLRAFTQGRTEQRIVALVAMDVTYKTAKSVGPGASKESVEAAYGKPTAVTMPFATEPRWIYDEIGLFVIIESNVGVFRPGMAKTIWKF